MALIQTLPNEILLHIFEKLSVDSLVACSATSQTLRRATDQSIWRLRCLEDFREWDQRHNLSALLKKPLNDVDWRTLYIERCGIHRNTQRALDGILASQVNRIDKVRSVIDYGLDIKEVLVRNINTDSSASDVLSRRWYARLVLARLQRERAIRIWCGFLDGGTVDLVEALYAFDLFVRQDKAPSYDEIQDLLEHHATACQHSVDDWTNLTTRDKALSLARYLVRNDLVGLRGDHEYSNVRNSFIAHALTHDEHLSLQLISTAIYCGIARILGLDARPCGFPGHVITIVFPQEGFDLDGRSLTTSRNSMNQHHLRMYLDPFQTDLEKPARELLLSLQLLGITGPDADRALAPSTTAEIVTRCGRNILSATQNQRQQGRTEPRDGSGVDPEVAFYGALWCSIIISSAGNAAVTMHPRWSYLTAFIERFEHHFPYDAHLLVDIIGPLLQSTEERQLIHSHVRDVLGKDSLPPPVKFRSDVDVGSVQYCVGQLFRHLRYDYRGLIYGWDVSCSASEVWIRQMQVMSLDRGKQQSFYHILAEDGSTRYVAEDNIEIIQPPKPPVALVDPAGQWFKRWDSVGHMFVSNITDEYPDN